MVIVVQVLLRGVKVFKQTKDDVLYSMLRLIYLIITNVEVTKYIQKIRVTLAVTKP